MPPPDEQRGDLDAHVDAVLRGERVDPFPRGVGTFVGANLLMTISAGLWIVSVPSALTDGSTASAANAEMLSIALALPTLVVPPALTAFGVRGGDALMRVAVWLWLVGNAVAAAAGVAGGLAVHWWLLAIGAAAAGGALALVRVDAFAGFVEFKRRLRERRPGVQARGK